MATDPKKDEFKGSEITDEQLENVAGGNRVPAPRAGKNLPASELSDEDLEGIAGGGLTVDPTDSIKPPVRKPIVLIPEEAPD